MYVVSHFCFSTFKLHPHTLPLPRYPSSLSSAVCMFLSLRRFHLLSVPGLIASPTISVLSLLVLSFENAAEL